MLYTTIEELRTEGITEAMANDDKCSKIIGLACKYIDMSTGRWFELKDKTIKLNGNDSNIIHLPEFPYSVASVKVNGDILSPSEYVVYNRFIPDDRWYPKIVFNYFVKKGFQNIVITGQFGFVEEDGSIPVEINKVCKMLCLNELDPLIEKKENAERKRIISEKTDDHSYTLNNLIVTGILTGDNEIDGILQYYRREVELSLL